MPIVFGKRTLLFGEAEERPWVRFFILGRSGSKVDKVCSVVVILRPAALLERHLPLNRARSEVILSSPPRLRATTIISWHAACAPSLFTIISSSSFAFNLFDNPSLQSRR